MRARYIGNPKRAGEGPEETSFFGLTFRKGEWRSVDSLDATGLRKLINNTHFQIEDRNGGAAPVQPSKPADSPAVETIPSNWRESHAQTRKKWARQIGADPKNIEEADAAIEKHLASPPPPPPPPPPQSIADPPKGDDDDDWGDLDPQ